MDPALQTILWPMFALGVAVGVFGWMLYWAGVQVIGAFVGASAGFSLVMMADARFGFEKLLMIVIALGMLAGGAAGVFLMRTIHFYAFFVMGLALGIPVGPAVLGLFPDAAWAAGGQAVALSSMISALLGGFIVLAARRYVLAVVAAMLSGAMIAMSLPYSIETKLIVATAGFLASSAVQIGLVRMFLPSDTVNLLDVKKGAPKKKMSSKKSKKSS